MARAKHYVPEVSRHLVKVLYFEGRRRKMPITRLVDEILTAALIATPGWEIAESELSASKDKDRHNADY
jgi:hypothetical protein